MVIFTFDLLNSGVPRAIIFQQLRYDKIDEYLPVVSVEFLHLPPLKWVPTINLWNFILLLMLIKVIYSNSMIDWLCSTRIICLQQNFTICRTFIVGKFSQDFLTEFNLCKSK